MGWRGAFFRYSETAIWAVRGKEGGSGRELRTAAAGAGATLNGGIRVIAVRRLPPGLCGEIVFSVLCLFSLRYVPRERGRLTVDAHAAHLHTGANG